MQLTAGRSDDLAVPGEPYTFGTLVDAQALGDLVALQERGRPVARVELGPDVPAGIARLASEKSRPERSGATPPADSQPGPSSEQALGPFSERVLEHLLVQSPPKPTLVCCHSAT